MIIEEIRESMLRSFKERLPDFNITFKPYKGGFCIVDVTLVKEDVELWRTLSADSLMQVTRLVKKEGGPDESDCDALVSTLVQGIKDEYRLRLRGREVK